MAQISVEDPKQVLILVAAAILGGGLLLSGLGRKGQKVGGALVVISGASQGIGEAVARLLVSKGGRVVLLARSQDKLEDVKKSIEKAYGGGKVWALKCDCSSASDVDRVVKEIRKIGVPDAIVNNAGAGQWKYLSESSAEDIKSYFDAPPLAAALLTRAFFLDFLERDSGAIVQVMSPGATAYNMARWALRGFSEALSGDVYGTKVRVQDVWLGEVTSEYFNNNPGSIERVPPGGGSAISCETAARAVVRAIESGARSTYEPATLWLYFGCIPFILRQWVGMHGVAVRRKYLQGLKRD